VQTAVIATQNLLGKNDTLTDRQLLVKKIFHEFFDVSGISHKIFAKNYTDEPTAEQIGKAIGYLASKKRF
jgi:hypothetical protein